MRKVTKIWVKIDNNSKILRKDMSRSIFDYSSRTLSIGLRGAEGIPVIDINIK